ncbi:hypothetical protein NVIE_2113 [Nitrososphaera viennensis EN76]|uniref:Uncharacterized protein n=1 Tax=Nitrososphaera viennensis EN76 TaxID=926571 RepID=A0A060HT47_9ARCH|nr:hypothetical protein NVIE_2113 [Nitrososphaera viennensis EN76]
MHRPALESVSSKAMWRSVMGARWQKLA